MLKFIPFLVLLLALSSCSKDSSDLTNANIEDRAEEVQTEMDLNVSVSYVDHAGPTCEPIYLENVQVQLLEGNVSMLDFSSDNIVMSRRTDDNGDATLERLSPGMYSVYVSTNYGETIKPFTVISGSLNLLVIELKR